MGRFMASRVVRAVLALLPRLTGALCLRLSLMFQAMGEALLVASIKLRGW